MPFKPGQSGNPAGRRKGPSEISILAKKKAPEAFKRIIELMQCTDRRIAIVAAQEVLNRAYGKPAQAVEITKDVVHYVVKVPAIAPSPEEWTQQYQPKSLTQ